MWRHFTASILTAVIVVGFPGAALARLDDRATSPAAMLAAEPSTDKCSDWGPWPDGPLKACIAVKNGTVIGTGQVRNRPGAILWIEICEHHGPCRLPVMANRVDVGLPPGQYETVFYLGAGGGAQTSPVLTVPQRLAFRGVD